MKIPYLQKSLKLITCVFMLSLLSGCANNFTITSRYVNGQKIENGVNDYREIGLEVKGRGTTSETLLLSFPRVLNQVVEIFMSDRDKNKVKK